MFLSVFEMFKVGIGPSSSHTMGPMVAAARFLDSLRASPFQPRGVRASLHGSLAFTGVGHATDRAVILGLAGFAPDTYDATRADAALAVIRAKHVVLPPGLPPLAFDPARDLVFDYGPALPGHANGLILRATDAQGDVILSETFYSIGGGFVLTDAVIQARFRTTVAIPHRDVKGHVSTWHVTVVPLTAVDWTPDRPIPAWVACPLFRCVEGDGRSFLAIHEVQEDGYGQARDEARAKHGLRDAPGAPIVESVASIPEAIADRGDVLIDVWIWVYGGWAIGLGGYMLLRGSRHGAGGLKPRAAAR